jgi:hypothetical protein
MLSQEPTTAAWLLPPRVDVGMLRAPASPRMGIALPESVVTAELENQGERKNYVHLCYTGTFMGPVKANSCGAGSPVLK